jgi:hypothetical protein
MASQLISYIAPSAPATRRPARGDEWFLRPEIGFTPNWFHQSLGIDFGEFWHTDPAYRLKTVLMMKNELRRRFPGTSIGRIDEPDYPPDLLTGVYGTCTIAAIFGIPIIYSENNWPTSAHHYISDEEADKLVPPELATNIHFSALMDQVDVIGKTSGRIEGYINWQGVLNNAYRLRGQEIYTDMMLYPERAIRIFNCITITMIEGAKRLHQRQFQSGVNIRFMTLSNCLVNMVSPDEYSKLLLSFDQQIAGAFETTGIHNCAWNANPYLQSYREVPEPGYLDMGINSDLKLARKLFPETRRAIMYTPMDLSGKSVSELRNDAERIARDYGPCDLVVADIEAGTPDSRILGLIEICRNISKRS